MNDLTEQWKKGELPSGYYYVKNEFGNIFPSDYSEDYDNIGDTVIKDFFTEISEIKEVLEPVPSYDELQNINKSVNDLMASNIKLVEENTKLKELLKECKKILGESQTTNPIVYFRWENDLINKIDEVLK